MAGIVLLAIFATFAAFVGVLSPYDPRDISPTEQHQGPSLHHWCGTDDFGRDLLTRLGYGARVSLLIGVSAVGISMLIGIPIGATAGYFGSGYDMMISRLVDLMLSFPGILLAIAIAAPLGAGLKTVVLSVGIVGIPQWARQIRASVLEIKEMDFVQASRALGAGPMRILFLSILPNALGPIIVLATLGVGTSILTAAGLSFLGLGVETGTPEWGAMLHDAYQFWRQASGPAIFSGLAISLCVLAFNLFGDGLQDAFDPRSRLRPF